VEGLPEGFRFHDLRHFYASLLIASGLDVKVVQARLRHASAKTTLDTDGHLWPDSDDTGRHQQCDDDPKWNSCGHLAAIGSCR
jgi:integrase